MMLVVIKKPSPIPLNNMTKYSSEKSAMRNIIVYIRISRLPMRHIRLVITLV